MTQMDTHTAYCFFLSISLSPRLSLLFDLETYLPKQ